VRRGVLRRLDATQPQYRRRRTQFGRDIDRLLRWLRERALPISLLVGTLTIPAYAGIQLAGRG
jgi:hypothetical protein